MIEAGRILVAGGAGRLGSALARLGGNAPGRDQLDITDASKITAAIEQSAPSAVINAAAYTNVDGAETESDLANRINAYGAGTLARLCAVAGIPLLHVSTDMVFSEGDPELPISETARPAPNSVYGESKLEGEMQVRAAGGRHCITRVSWLFSDEGESFISKILAVGAKRGQLDLVDDEYGRPTHVDPLAAHLVQLAQMLADGTAVPGLLHLGPADPVSRYGWAKEIFSVAEKAGGPSPELKPVPGSHFPTPAARARGVILDVNQADALLGPMPAWHPFSETVVHKLLERG
ncbi:dTDP-4-dehydrorhamnose reductase [Henriciella marina]|uniref:dTDP-4-dehydrorhamnose reductase n=1 Tax=Henriciella marina TaxID=453851 RepID=UPI00036E8F46|nr:dTDP-4-dehydrorhamnose reductase [Henriciella marina]